MKDAQTGSVWTHYDGSVLTGPLANSGVQLEIAPVIHTTWAEWTALHPETQVLDWYPEFAHRYRQVEPGRFGLAEVFQDTILNWDNRLSHNELVLGATANGEFRAYVLADFAAGAAVIHDVLGGVPVVVFVDSGNNYALAFQSIAGGRQLEFSADAGQFVDAGGTVWGADGLAISGPLAGTQLAFVTSFVSEWYGWAAYHPDTSIYGR